MSYPENQYVPVPVVNGSTKVTESVPNPIQIAVKEAQQFLGTSGKPASWNLDALDFFTSIQSNPLRLAYKDADEITVKAGYAAPKNAAESIKLLRKQVSDTDLVFDSVVGSSSTRSADTSYLVWALADSSGTGLDYEITEVQSAPDTTGGQYQLVGGFATDSSEDIIESSVWSAVGVKVVNVAYFQTGDYASGTTAIPTDSSIPQDNEGDEYMSLSYVPKKSTNILMIDVVATLSNGTQAHVRACLFQDGVASALRVGSTSNVNVNNIETVAFTHFMEAGTDSPITFKVRCGSASGTTYFNGTSSGVEFGGVLASSIAITEFELN